MCGMWINDPPCQSLSAAGTAETKVELLCQKRRKRPTESDGLETVRAREVRPEEHQKADQPAVPSPVVSAPETARNENAPPTVSPTVVHVGVVEAKGGISYADALSGTKKKLAASTPKSLERPLTASSPL